MNNFPIIDAGFDQEFSLFDAAFDDELIHFWWQIFVIDADTMMTFC